MKYHVMWAVVLLFGSLGSSPTIGGQTQPEETTSVSLVRGLDGGDYTPYAPNVIERVQQALQTRGLYNGAIDGVLGETTMEAIAQFQRQNNLQVCGVPTPQTRRLLMQEGAASSSRGQQ
jgi:hypothetical protein